MNQAQPQDLGLRTTAFAENVRAFIKKIPKSMVIFDDVKQLLRSSGSVGANFIEANETGELLRIFSAITYRYSHMAT